MKVVNLGENNSVLNTYIAEIRDARIQKDSLRFRTNLQRVGRVFAYEISRTLQYSEKDVTTPLAVARVSTFDTPLVIAAILRAGMPLQSGILDVFDHAESAFLSTYRKHGKGDYFKVYSDYCTCPSLEGKTLIVADPLLATGASMESALLKLEEEGGEAATIHLVCPCRNWTTNTPSGWPPSMRNSPVTTTSFPASETPETWPTAAKDSRILHYEKSLYRNLRVSDECQ